MKNFLYGIIYTIVVAGALVHFSGCNVPEISEITAMLTPPPTVTATPTPVATADGNGRETAATPAAESEKTEMIDGLVVTETDDYVWTTGSVNVRKGPNTDYDKLGALSRNTKVHRTGICENGWIRIEYKELTAYMSGKYYTTTEPDVTTAPGTTLTPTPKAKTTSASKATSVPTSTPVAKNTATATPSPSPAVNDDPSTILASMNSVGSNVDTKGAADFYYETEKTATAAFLKYASTSTTFSILYKDKSCMHTPEYFLATYPELYWVEIDYNLSTRYSNAIYVVFNVTMKEGGQYAYAIRTGDTSYLTDEELYALKAVKKLSDSLKLSDLSDIELVLKVHDYLINNTKYDTNYNKVSHTPYGLITNKVAVCDGYAETFMIFMLLNDIDCQTVTGYASEDHAWNQVCLDNKWYNIDVTWDDPITKDSKTGNVVDTLRYTYFMINDEVLSETHTSTCGYEEKCTSDKYHLYTYKQYYCDSDDDVKAQIEAQKNNDSIFFVYKKGRYLKEDLVSIFQSVYNVALSSYAPIEVRSGYMMFEVINPFR
ncbi:MAG: SH3 domain-containing protein [Lachnospiraceae bacterium]|nr:SH3 domain-containing protein [Lachnospiraceae bacterium]